MARSFTSNEAKTLRNIHEKLYKELSAGAFTQEGIVKGIQNLAGGMQERELVQILGGIPIEEINREKQGIKTKTLRTYGYETVADIWKTSEDKLEAINGISRAGGKLILKEVNHIVENARKSAKIRINYDEKTEETGKLVKYLAIYRRTYPVFGQVQDLLEKNSTDVSNALADLKTGTNIFRWIFSSKAKKAQAEQAYGWLLDLSHSEYAISGTEALNQIQERLKISETDAWEDFRENSIHYYNLLERLCPGCVESEGEVYGLPEDLAGEIQNQVVLEDGLRCTLRRYQEFFTSIGNLVNLLSAGTNTTLTIDSTQADIIKNLGFGESLVMLILSALLAIIIIICGFFIIYTVYFRFLKLLIIVPLGAIAASTMAGNRTVSHTWVTYCKYFLSVTFEAVTMALAIVVCNAFISAGLPTFTSSYEPWAQTLIYLCEMTFTVAMTVGSVKGAQSLTSKAFGL